MKIKCTLTRICLLCAAGLGMVIHEAKAAGWVTTGSLNTARENHTATLLPNGKVLVTGGENNNSGMYVFPTSTELYDPASGTWTTTGSLNTPRDTHTATCLPSGKVLVAGGQYWNGSAYICPSSAELYDPVSGTWTTTDSLNAARYSHTATLLPNGKVLVAAGWNDPDNDPTNNAEIYDPVSGIWSTTGALHIKRYCHTATLLPNGKVLVAGGTGDFDTGYSALSSAELYDPASGTWTTTGSLNTERQWHTATLLPNGKVLVVGGMDNDGDTLASAELYNPTNGTWTATGSLNTERQNHTATLLPDGTVLVVGGVDDSGYPSGGAELYDPTSGAWSPVDSLVGFGLCSHTATLLADDSVLVVGGYTGSVYAGAELYWPSESPGPIFLADTVKLPGGACRFSFANTPGLGFTVLAATNLALPLSNWMVMGSATEVSPSQYRFTDPQATNYTKLFYRVRSP